MALTREAALRYGSEFPRDTRELGELIAPHLREGDVLILTGGLGAGKTQLTGGLARGLGDMRPVTSPTFTIQSIHDRGRIPLFHFDLYRLEHACELEDTGLFDVLGVEGVCVLEWGERFQGELVDERLDVLISRARDGEGRLIALDPHGERAERIARQLDGAMGDRARGGVTDA